MLALRKPHRQRAAAPSSRCGEAVPAAAHSRHPCGLHAEAVVRGERRSPVSGLEEEDPAAEHTLFDVSAAVQAGGRIRSGPAARDEAVVLEEEELRLAPVRIWAAAAGQRAGRSPAGPGKGGPRRVGRADGRGCCSSRRVGSVCRDGLAWAA